jgi:murein DD-endopeptidase MepM/ murein hydrolase activator NlpD
VPKNTRIILIPDDERSSREYIIGRWMIVLLTGLVILLAALVIFILVSHASLLGQVGQVGQLQRELEEANGRIAAVEELSQELEAMRALQERLLVMLGVQRPSVGDEDSLLVAWTHQEEPQEGSEGTNTLEQVATFVITPPPSRWPVSGYVTREFREGDLPRGIRPHHGIDIAAPQDTPLVAAGKGRVLKARWDDHLGNFVEIQHGFGYVTVYGHCSRLTVKEGDRVDQGQLIGYLGGTGQASAPHLHFEVWKDGAVVDPRQILPGEPPR